MIVTIGIRKEVATKCRQSHSCGIQMLMKGLEIIRQSPETSLKTQETMKLQVSGEQST